MENVEKGILIRREIMFACDILTKAYAIINKIDVGGEQTITTFLYMCSTGIERLLKIIIILNYYKKNNDFPNNRYIRNFSHSIEELLKKIFNIFEEEKIDVDIKNINMDLINIISQYSIYDRYHNLNNICNNNPDNTSDYIIKFNEMLKNNCLKYKKHGTKVKIFNEKYNNYLKEIAIINYENIDRTPITSFNELFIAKSLNKEYRKYFRISYYILVKTIVGLLERYLIEDLDLTFAYEYWQNFNCDVDYIKTRVKLE